MLRNVKKTIIHNVYYLKGEFRRNNKNLLLYNLTQIMSVFSYLYTNFKMLITIMFKQLMLPSQFTQRHW